MISSRAGTAAGSHSSADAWFTPWRFAAFLALLIAACFPQVITGAGSFFYRDYSLFGYPLAYYHRESFWRGQIPLWDPLNNCGLPFLAQWNTLTLYPLSLFYLVLPLPWSLGVFCLGHLFLAGMGMYFLAHRWTGDRLAAAIAGTAFAFNGLTWHALMWPNDIAALAWMPWVVLAVERAWREGGRRIAIAGLAGAVQMLAGAPEVILQTWFFLGCLWLAQCLMREISPVKMVARAFGAGALVAALAAAQLLPFLHLLGRSQRDTTFGGSQWSMPASGWGNYLVALFHDTPAGHGVYAQHEQYWTSSYFLGVGTVALAMFAAWRVRRRRVWLLAVVALFSLTMALGDHGGVYPLLRKMLPQIGFMRFPIKLVVLATFSLPLLAAHGLAWLRRLPPYDWAREWKLLRRLALVLFGLMIVILICARIYPQRGDNFGTTLFSGLRGAGFLALILGCLGLLHWKPERRTQQLLQSVLMMLFWFDVFTHVPNLSPTTDPKVFKPDEMRNDYYKWDTQLRPGESRIMLTRASIVKMYWGAQAKPEDEVYGHRLVFYDNMNLLDDVPKLDGFFSLYPREMNTAITELYVSTNDLRGFKDFLGVAQVNTPTNAMEWTARDSFSPLVTGGQEPVFADAATTLRLVTDPSFDGRAKIYLPPAAKAVIQATNATTVKITATNFSAQRVEFQVEAAGPAMISIAQAYYDAWRASVDGRPVALWRGNYAFQALEVPAGSHRVELVYRDKQFLAGGVISVAALLVCVVVWIPRRRSRQ